jgi:hypothetical protein
MTSTYDHGESAHNEVLALRLGQQSQQTEPSYAQTYGANASDGSARD